MWLKTNGSKYPILARIARDVYVIPISTVASESTFSTGGRVVSPHYSKLHPNTLEALMCAQNWLLAKKRDMKVIKIKLMLVYCIYLIPINIFYLYICVGLDKKAQQVDCYKEDSDGDAEGLNYDNYILHF